MTAKPVTGVAVSTRHRNAMGLKWNSVPGATGYVVNYGTSPGQLNSTHAITGGRSTSTVVGNLPPGTLHHFQVTAQPAKLGSPSSQIVSSSTEAASL